MFTNDGSLFNSATRAREAKAGREKAAAVADAEHEGRRDVHEAEMRIIPLKASLHRNRVSVAAHVSTEEALVAELARLAPDNPLASMEAVNKMSSYKEDVLFFDKDIAKRTLGDVEVETFFCTETVAKNKIAAAIAEEALANGAIFKP